MYVLTRFNDMNSNTLRLMREINKNSASNAFDDDIACDMNNIMLVCIRRELCFSNHIINELCVSSAAFSSINNFKEVPFGKALY